ncbi:Oidioi.mRNA.OKI2018_I69.PAR.g12315.t1.cds [Oikopleura dioica]|uniref:Oidioi.mRNA.OKI2018_I69.PAR.g12315.t1.cds n=1 Tax=Oikopleura dioica TaxID=34765 RepID=A0ABN7S423_OIKDI|nr:Oidioi.mRNA.OKI2018_I69.PAR.g12315.t1.cds [Oikopleura dioica]
MLMRLVQAGADPKIRNNLGQLPEEIVPTTVEREIASWNNELGNARFTDSIEYPSPRFAQRHWSVDSNGFNSNGSSIESQNSGRNSPCSIISLNEKTRIPAYRFADDFRDTYCPSSTGEERAKEGTIVVANKEDLTPISRFIARFVDYIEDIAIASCKIEIIRAAAIVIDPLFDALEGDLLPSSNWDLTILPLNSTIDPCAFADNGTKMNIMNRAVKIINAVDWVDDQFDFIELFWKVYGQFFSI